jgi:hypothetical protein
MISRRRDSWLGSRNMHAFVLPTVGC